MTRKAVGIASLGLGVLLIFAAVAMMSANEPPVVTTTTLTSTTTLVPEPTTTTTAAPTTTTAPSTTTTTVPPETVEGFVTLYLQALDEDNIEFLYQRLHPRVTEAYGEDLCRAWVEREIAVLSEYQLVGEASGPADQMFTDPNGEQFAIADTFTAPVRFVFEGTTFESEAQFALLDSDIYWLGACR